MCTSVNEVVCHGIPSPDEVLREGDIVNVDCSTIKDGFFSDSSRMFCIGEVSPEAADLVRVTKEAVQVGLDAIKPWGHLGDIGAAVNAYAREHGYTVVREFGGHGIGLEFHEDPFVSFVTEAGTGPILVPGLMLHHRAHDQRRRPGDRHDRPQRLDSPHRRSARSRPSGRSSSSSPKTATSCSAGRGIAHRAPFPKWWRQLYGRHTLSGPLRFRGGPLLCWFAFNQEPFL